MSYQFHFYEDRCVGCYACHTACISSHSALEETARGFRTIKKWVLESEGFQKNICPGCSHCGVCVQVCPARAIYRDIHTQLILINQNICTGCRKCETICPQQVIRFTKEAKAVKCDGCISLLEEGKEPACVRNCQKGAITMEER